MYLVKPIKPSELSNAIEAVLGGEPYEQIESVRAKQQRTAQSEQHLRILLAEDSAVNRELVMRMLEKRGHLVWAAENGLMTLELMEKERFDIVLMDVQMPEMDGFEATAAIRQRERATGAHVPIIALTAHALKRDRERCLDAGMDGYLPKPIRAGELFQAIESFAPNSPSDEASETGSDTAMEELTQQAHEHPAFDQAALLARVDGDLELLRMLIDLFFDESPKLLSEIEEAVEQGEAQKLERSAHKLKGAVSNFQAKAAFDAALRLEMLGREGNMAQARDGFESLRKEIARLTTALGALAACEPALASD